MNMQLFDLLRCDLISLTWIDTRTQVSCKYDLQMKSNTRSREKDNQKIGRNHHISYRKQKKTRQKQTDDGNGLGL